MSPSVKATLQAYQDYSRPYLTNQKECKTLIISTTGSPMRGNSMRERIKKLVSQTSITKSIDLHSLRHSIATHDKSNETTYLLAKSDRQDFPDNIDSVRLNTN